MNDLRDALERAERAAGPAALRQDSFARLVAYRERRLRNRRMGTGLLALLLTLVAFGAALHVFNHAGTFRPGKPTPIQPPTGSSGLIVFRRGINGSYTSIYTMKPDSSGLTQLIPTPKGDNDSNPWLSPDGSQVVFVRYINGNHITDSSTAPEHDVLMVINADGSGLHELAPGCTGACARQCRLSKLPCPGDDHPSWSPDGTRIVFERAYGPNIAHLTVAIWVANADGSDAMQLTQPQPGMSEDHSPSWSPDGRRIVFTRLDDTAPNGRRGSIYTIGADGNDLRLIYRFSDTWSGIGSDPRWSPEGSRILFSVFCHWGNGGGCPTTPTTGAHLFTIHPDGTGLEQITHGSLNEFYPAWSPDGRQIVFSRSFGGPNLSRDMYLMRANGTDIRPITNTGCPCEAEWGISP